MAIRRNVRTGASANSRHYIGASLAVGWLIAGAAHAQPQRVSYQGTLQVSGLPFDGTAEMKFAIVDGTDCIDGTDCETLWSNDGSSTSGAEPSASIDVDVASGFFTVHLGDTTIPNMTDPLSAENLTDALDASLRVWVSTGGGPFEQLTPDQPLSSAPFALMSEKVKGITVDDNGHVGIGTPSPDVPLVVRTFQNDDLPILGLEKASATAFDHYAGLAFRVANQLGQLPFDTTMVTDVLEGGNNLHGIGLWTRQNGATFAERVRISGNGLVGIGTANPSSLLHLNVPGGDDVAVKFENADSDWTVGVQGAIGDRFSISSTGSQDNPFIIERGNGSGVQNDSLVIRSNGNVTMDGNVGIGTTNPSSLLHLNQAGNDDDVQVKLQNGQSDWKIGIQGAIGDRFSINANNSADNPFVIERGNGSGVQNGSLTIRADGAVTMDGPVGIGAPPGEKLTVAGQIHSTSGGFRFPDGTVQATAQLVGPQGETGPQGPRGEQGPPGDPPPGVCTWNTSHTYSTGAICYTGVGVLCSLSQSNWYYLRCKPDGSWGGPYLDGNCSFSSGVLCGN